MIYVILRFDRGIQELLKKWISAFAGMTTLWENSSLYTETV